MEYVCLYFFSPVGLLFFFHNYFLHAASAGGGQLDRPASQRAGVGHVSAKHGLLGAAAASLSRLHQRFIFVPLFTLHIDVRCLLAPDIFIQQRSEGVNMC